MRFSLAHPSHALASLGGHASREELIGLGCDPRSIDLSVWYRSILPARKGWYALKGMPPPILTALRVGGRLACESAVAWHEGRDIPEPLHVIVAYGASRVVPGSSVVHWTRRAIRASRLVEFEESARARAERCRTRRAG